MQIELRPSSHDGTRLERELAGIDALGLEVPAAPNHLKAIWSGLWPKLLAVGIFLGAWQVVVWTHWKPAYVLPGPVPSFKAFFDSRTLLRSAATDTLERGAIGFALAIVIGCVIGIATAQLARAALGNRLDDHGPPDDAVDRVVPARDRALRPEQLGDPVRRDPRRGAVDRQRPPHRVRQHPADPAARGSRARRDRLVAAAAHRDPGVTAELRGRAQAGVVVRVAQPARR